MKAQSHYTLNPDPYRAGIELAEGLQDIEPEVIFLFSTIHYGFSSELTEAIYDVLENENLIVIGNTGDGFYETEKVSDIGAAALGINGGGNIRWHIGRAKGVSTDAGNAVKMCLEQITGQSGPDPLSLLYLVSDFRADARDLISNLRSRLDIPIIGGYAGDVNLRVQECCLYANKEVITDGLVMLGIEGNMAFDITVAHDLKPFGKPGIITEAARTRVKTVNDIPAMDFIENEIGKPIMAIDRGITTFNVIDRDDRSQKCIRSIVPDFETNDGSVILFSGIETGKEVQVCLADPEDLIAEVKSIGQSLKDLPFKPAAGIIISCAGRKHLLGKQIAHEVTDIISGMTVPFPVAGFPSFGELGPLKTDTGYSPALFHNMTYILALFGDSSE